MHFGVVIPIYFLCCGQLWVRHMICRQTCDGLYHFGESLVVRLYSEIDHIHLSSEAQCVSHLYPQVDCHILAFLPCVSTPPAESCVPMELDYTPWAVTGPDGQLVSTLFIISKDRAQIQKETDSYNKKKRIPIWLYPNKLLYCLML